MRQLLAGHSQGRSDNVKVLKAQGYPILRSILEDASFNATLGPASKIPAAFFTRLTDGDRKPVPQAPANAPAQDAAWVVGTSRREAVPRVRRLLALEGEYAPVAAKISSSSARKSNQAPGNNDNDADSDAGLDSDSDNIPGDAKGYKVLQCPLIFRDFNTSAPGGIFLNELLFVVSPVSFFMYNIERH